MGWISRDFDILVLTEVKINKTNRIKIQFFKIYANCRETHVNKNQHSGGGIIIAINKKINHEKIIFDKVELSDKNRLKINRDSNKLTSNNIGNIFTSKIIIITVIMIIITIVIILLILTATI